MEPPLPLRDPEDLPAGLVRQVDVQNDEIERSFAQVDQRGLCILRCADCVSPYLEIAREQVAQNLIIFHQQDACAGDIDHLLFASRSCYHKQCSSVLSRGGSSFASTSCIGESAPCCPRNPRSHDRKRVPRCGFCVRSRGGDRRMSTSKAGGSMSRCFTSWSCSNSVFPPLVTRMIPSQCS